MPYDGSNLVFLISQPRAGSTLLQHLIAQHNDVFAPPEPWLMLHPLYGRTPNGITAEYNADWASDFVTHFVQDSCGGEQTYRRAIALFAGTLYTEALSRANKDIFLDKTPRYYYVIDQLLDIFPQARFIFLIRNPLSVLHSIIHTWFQDGRLDGLHRFRDDLIKAPDLILAGIKAAGTRGHTVYYEDLVTTPAATMQALSDAIGLQYAESMLAYSSTQNPGHIPGDPVGIHNNDRPSTDSLDKWQTLANTAQLRHLGQCYLQALGEQTISAMHYDMRELQDGIQSSEPPATGSIARWDSLLKPPRERTLRERCAVHFAVTRARHGLASSLVRTTQQAVKTITHTA